MEQIKNQPCPLCRAKSLTLAQQEEEIPFFGKVLVFSMTCDSCKYHLADVEAIEEKEPSKYIFETSSAEDMNVRIVKSSKATIKIPQLRMTVTPGPASQGYVSNIEGVLERFEKVVEEQRDLAEDISEKKSAKNLLKKIRKVKLGDIKIKVIIEDPTGNSAIISKKAKIEKLK